MRIIQKMEGARILSVLLLLLATCTSRTLEVSSGDLRLVGGTSSRGRLEIFYSGEWGTVCEDLFSINEAESACRQLGFFGLTRLGTVGSLGYFQGTGRIWLDDVVCPNTRTPLLQCNHNSLGSHNCGHSQDVALVCTITPSSGDLRLVSSSSSSGRGRLEIYWSGQWGTVCDDGFGTTEANVACRQLAFSGATRSGNVITLGYSQGTGRIWLSNVDCSTSSTMLWLCHHDGFGVNVTCSHSDDVALECSRSSYGDLRLVGSSSRGRLEILVNGEWGTVCDDGFGNDELGVACRQLGFRVPTEIGNVRSLGIPAGTGPIWLDSVDCSSLLTRLAPDVRLINCRHDGLGVHNCVHNEDVAIACGGDPTASIIGGIFGGLILFVFLISIILCCIFFCNKYIRSRRLPTVAPLQPAVTGTSDQGVATEPASRPVQQHNAKPQELPDYPTNSELQSAPPPSYDAAVQNYPTIM